jgi:hypothetical protein
MINCPKDITPNSFLGAFGLKPNQNTTRSSDLEIEAIQDKTASITLEEGKMAQNQG